ncbi:MAG TPA: histidine kinase dimerization/phospho-acceptor domain-containing protein, partial [Chloroflexota bacterium]|nr:histidine kinase dimerization/phospho-acceptor domain-containing protein [Chloroflexota bacterium]
MSAEGWLDLGSGWLFASIRDAVLVVDAQTGGIVLSNPAATDLFGHSADELRERSIELVVPDLRLMPQWETLLAGPAPADTILVFGEHRDGTEVSVELTLTRLESPTDGRLFLVAVMRDITERRLAEEERIGRIREHAAQQESAAAQRRLEVLAEASRLLDASLDYEATLQEVARVAASTLADWCIVHLLEADGSIRWLAVAHGDPDKEAVARELHRRYPATLDRRQGVGRVLSTGETEVYARIPESQRMARARDPEHLRLLRALGSCSSMIVPLSTRGRMLGALSLISSRPDRHYDKNDVATAEELARRCAQAVDNARLHQEAQTALRAREQFVSIASHELRTPIARVKGYAEMLLAAHADGELDDELLVRSLRRIDTASERLAGLVRDLLDVSRMTSGGLP